MLELLVPRGCTCNVLVLQLRADFVPVAAESRTSFPSIQPYPRSPKQRNWNIDKGPFLPATSYMAIIKACGQPVLVSEG